MSTPMIIGIVALVIVIIVAIALFVRSRNK
jgi:hypothetical protein